MTYESHVNSDSKSEQHQNLINNHRFIFLTISSAVSSFSFAVYALSEEWYVVAGLNRIELLGIVMMLTLIPRILFMFIGGTLSDHIERKTILFLSDFICGWLVGGMAILIYVNLLNIWLLMLFALLFGLLDAVYWPANRSILPFIVHKNKLTRANSIVQGTNQTLMIAGPVVGALIIQWINFTGVFTIISLLLLSGSLLNLKIGEAGHSNKTKNTLSNDLSETIAYIKTVPYIMIMLMTNLMVNFFISGPISLSLPILVNNVIEGDALELSFLEGALFVGMVVGSFFAGIANIQNKRAILIVGLMGFLGICTLLMSTMKTVGFGLIIIVITGVIMAVINILAPSLLQSVVRPEMMGRVQSITAMGGMGLTPLSFALVSILLSSGISVTNILLVSGILVIIVSIIILLKARTLWHVD